MNAAERRWRTVVVTVATLAAVLATGRLGLWQLDRAAQKNALRDAMESGALLPALHSPALPRTAEQATALRFRRVQLQGEWLNEHTVFLENRQMNGRPGFFVITPLKLPDMAGSLLVQRGWAPRHVQERTRLPELATPAGVVEVEGAIVPPPTRLFEFSPEPGGSIRQNLDPEAFAVEIRQVLLPFSVLQGDSASVQGDGLLRQWPRPGIDTRTNYGYAFQWFSLAALMTGLYVWFQLIQPRRRKS